MFVIPPATDENEPDGMMAYLKAIQNPDRSDPNWPLPSFDARDWAEAFVARIKAKPSIATDEGAMLAWFAGALMRGYDEAQLRMARAKQADATDVSLEAFKAPDTIDRSVLKTWATASQGDHLVT